MKNRMLTVLLTLAIILGVVPMMVMSAGACNHQEHSAEWKCISNNDNTHSMTCVCGEVVGTADCVEDCLCCGDAATICDHQAHCTEWTHVSNNDNTHTMTCVCGEVIGTLNCAENCLCGGDAATVCDHGAHAAEWTCKSNDRICICGEKLGPADCDTPCAQRQSNHCARSKGAHH